MNWADRATIAFIALGGAWIVVAAIREATEKICRHLDTLHQDFHDWRNRH